MKILKILIVVFWIVMLGLFLHLEVLPGLFGYKQLSYLELIPKDLLFRDNWLGVYFQGIKVGYMHNYLSIPRQGPISQFWIKNTALLELPILGRTEEVRFNAQALIDGAYTLKNFRLDLSSSCYSTQLEGELNAEGALDLCIESSGKKRNIRLNLPPEAVVYSPFTPLPIGKLTSRRKFTIKVFDPITLGVERVFIEPVGTERIIISQSEVEALKLKIRYRGIESLAWVTREGELLKEETSLGWVIVKERPQEIFTFLKEKPQAMIDLITSTSLPSNIEFPDPQELRSLQVILKGYSLDLKNLADRRQTILNAEQGAITLRINPSVPPDEPFSLPITDEALLPFLQSTIFVQSDDEEIIKTAEAIVGQEKDSWKAALLLNQWVYRKVSKIPTASIPSSIAVLHQLQGDCNEHTFLYTALARAVAIPTRMAYGLVYQQGAFFYHAWPEVFVGKWVALDPTLGQDIASVTHIKLLEGEMKNQLDLVKLIGKLEIKIEEFK